MGKYKKEIKKTILILSLLSLIITIYEIVNVYAVFYSELSGSAEQNIAKWQIEINGTDIVSATAREFVIGKLSTTENEHTAGKKLAPGATGSFEIEIRPKDTQVSIRYDISIDQSNITNQKITLDSVKEIDTENMLVRTDENIYTGIISLAEMTIEDYVKNIKIIFKWENDENNTEDIVIGTVENLKLQIPILVTVSQYMGEEIIEYDPDI